MLVGSSKLLNIFHIPQPGPQAKCVPNTPDKGSIDTGMITKAVRLGDNGSAHCATPVKLISPNFFEVNP